METHQNPRRVRNPRIGARLVDLHELYLGLGDGEATRYRAYLDFLAKEAQRSAFSLARVHFVGSARFLTRMEARFGVRAGGRAARAPYSDWPWRLGLRPPPGQMQPITLTCAIITTATEGGVCLRNVPGTLPLGWALARPAFSSADPRASLMVSDLPGRMPSKTAGGGLNLQPRATPRLSVPTTGTWLPRGS